MVVCVGLVYSDEKFTKIEGETMINFNQIALVTVAAIGFFAGCDNASDEKKNSLDDGRATVALDDGRTTIALNIAAVNSASNAPAPYVGFAAAEAANEPGFTHPPDTSVYSPYINAGPPEYVKITITEIVVKGDWGADVLWSGAKEFVLDGGPMDVSDMTRTFQRIQMGRATSIKTTFKNLAKVKGSLTGIFNPNPTGFNQELLTVSTKASYAYNAATQKGGADSYAVFATGSAEEMEYSLGANGDTFTVEAPCDTVLDGNTTLTILFDLNRLLRFYNGRNTTHSGGVFPGDPNDKAFFFGHSFLGSFIAPFFGKPGTIEGYRTVYSAENPGTVGQYMQVDGWMTLAFDAEGTFMTGILMGDDDNALTVAKGLVKTFSDGDSFTYDISGGTVNGFSRLSTVGSWSSPIPTFITTKVPSQGEAKFQLVLKK